jgi:D-alanine-D-alanine ligase
VNHTTIVLFGGRSDERHVSVASAQNIVRTLDNVLAWFWSPDGRVHDVAVRELLAHERPFEVDFVHSRPAIFPTLEQALDTIPVDDPLFLLALHGGEGEDGTVQRMLEQRRIPFTGSGSEASAAAFDKQRAKELVEEGVPIPDGRIVKDLSRLRSVIDYMLSRHERIVLKPLAAGSSRGLFFLDRGADPTEIEQKVVEVAVPYIIEQFVAGRELTVGVVDGDSGPQALPVVEIEVEAGHTFDYEGKYLGKGTREVCPAEIPDSMATAVQQGAVAAHIALGCEGYSRSDFVASDDGIWFLELNTLPGLTTSSLVPQELAACGISFQSFLESQIELALRRAAAKA